MKRRVLVAITLALLLVAGDVAARPGGGGSFSRGGGGGGGGGGGRWGSPNGPEWDAGVDDLALPPIVEEILAVVIVAFLVYVYIDHRRNRVLPQEWTVPWWAAPARGGVGKDGWFGRRKEPAQEPPSSAELRAKLAESRRADPAFSLFAFEEDLCERVGKALRARESKIDDLVVGALRYEEVAGDDVTIDVDASYVEDDDLGRVRYWVTERCVVTGPEKIRLESIAKDVLVPLPKPPSTEWTSMPSGPSPGVRDAAAAAALDLGELEARVRAIFAALGEAYSARDAAPLEGFVTERFRQSFRYALEVHRANRAVMHLEETKIERVVLSAVMRDSVVETVYGTARRFVESDGGVLVSGSRYSTPRFAEQWTLGRAGDRWLLSHIGHDPP